MWALFEVSFVDVAAVVADGVGDVECEVVTSFFGSHTEKLCVLLLAQVLLEVLCQSAIRENDSW